ncbi:MAG: hypothetical protein ABSG16_11790 [Candidatus Acidiferrum sp.]
MSTDEVMAKKVKTAEETLEKAKADAAKADAEAAERQHTADNMAADDPKKASAAKVAAAAADRATAARAAVEAADKALRSAKRGGSSGENEITIFLNFYHNQSLARLHPTIPTDTKVDVWVTGETTSTSVALCQDGAKRYYISVLVAKKPSRATAGEKDPAAKVELPCDIPQEATPSVILQKFSNPVIADCKPYVMQSVQTDFQPSDAANRAAAESGTCNTVQIALVELQESYTFALTAFDMCIGDFIQHPEALIDKVQLRLTEVETPRPAAGGGKPQEQAARARTPFRGRTFSATTQEGYLEVPGLTHGKYYQAILIPPEGYLPASPLAQHHVYHEGAIHSLIVPFRPSGDFPSRSVIFVQEGSPGARVSGLQLQAGSESVSLDAGGGGIWNVPPTTTGRVLFQSPGKVFSPPFINLTKDAPLVLFVEVGDAAVSTPGRSSKSRFRHCDQNGDAISNRLLRLVSPSGSEETVRTDHEGWFEAEEGCVAFADEDDTTHRLDGIPLLRSEV